MELTDRALDELGDEITSLAGHLNATTCRWLELIAEFDAREGWAPWGCKSCAHWISWRCALTPGVAREHVRVARRIVDLPLIRDAFAAGELSYSKIRALTRIDDIKREAELLELARHSTASQLERIVRGYRRVLNQDAADASARRFLQVTYDDDGSVLVRGRLPRDEGAVLLKALDIARDDLRQAAWDAERGDVSAETPDMAPAEELSPGALAADALVAVAEQALAVRGGRDRSGGDRFQVVVHVDAETLAGTGDTSEDATCETEDGAPLAAETVRRLCCDASTVPLVEQDGRVLGVGRKTRTIPPSLRRALKTRDGGCRFPGCMQQRHVDAHHIQHWAHGGRTDLDNLVLLCRRHHTLLHEGGYRIELGSGGLSFRRPDGRRLLASPPLAGEHAALLRANAGRPITPQTTVPRWNGDVLHLGDAVEAVMHFAN